MKALKDMTRKELIEKIHQLNRGKGQLQASLIAIRADFRLVYKRLKCMTDNIHIPENKLCNPKFHPGGNGNKKSS